MINEQPRHGVDHLRRLPDQSVALVITVAPLPTPDAEGDFERDSYLAQLLAVGDESSRILQPTGTFIFAMRCRLADESRHGCETDLVFGMQDKGWLWTEEWRCVWSPAPTTTTTRTGFFADAWMPVHQFNRQRRFVMNQEAVRVPMAESTRKRIANLSEKDKTRVESATGSGFGKKVSNWAGRELVNPTNVLALGEDEPSAGHIPTTMCDLFIKLFSTEGDVVVDPFGASDTLRAAATRLGRGFVGAE